MFNKIKALVDDVTVWGVTTMQQFSNIVPASHIIADTLLSIKYAKLFSLRDHMMGAARFGMSLGYIAVLPHSQLTFFSISPWF